MFETISQSLETMLSTMGPLAPLVYILLYVLTALVSIIPTPLVSALGGSVLGFWPAVIYGCVGLALGAFIALSLMRRFGRPLLYKLVSEKVIAQWEYLLGIQSVPMWGVVFLALNVDLAVMIAGLTKLSVVRLWLAAVIARMPWVILSAWLGRSFIEDGNLLVTSIVVVILLVLVFMIMRRAVKLYLKDSKANSV